MPSIQWNPAWETKIPVLDDQHRYLVARMQDLLDALGGENAEAESNRTLQLLGSYVDFHFRTEEIYMAEAGYEDLEAHRAGHDALRLKIQELLLKPDWSAGLLPERVLAYLNGWLGEHLGGADREMADHFRRAEARRRVTAG